MNAPVRLQSAQSVEEKAADWIEKREAGGWSEADDGAFEAWLAQSPVHRVSYLRLKSAWARADRLVVLRPQPASTPDDRKPWRLAALRAAAGVLLLIAGTTAIREAPTVADNTYTTRLGEHKRVALSDGSEVELNTNTVLRAQITAKMRTVTLERGEAYFEVRHDASKPFVVKLGTHTVTDIGTKFFIRRDATRTSVGVTEGRVQFETADSIRPANPIVLSAGNLAVATPGRITISTQSDKVLSNDLAWRSGMLVFNRTTLAAAVAEFNRYNHEKLVLADPRASSLLIGGTFRTSDVKLFERVAQDLLGVHLKDQSEHVSP